MSKPRFTLGDLLTWVALAALIAALLAAMFGPSSRSGFVQKLAVAADGSTAAALFSDGTVRVWNAADGKPAAAPITAPGAWSLSLSADGKVLALGRPTNPLGVSLVQLYSVELRELATGKVLRTFPGPPDTQVVFAPRGGRVASCYPAGTIELYEPPLDTARSIRLAVGSPGAADNWHDPVFSPDGQLLAVANHNKEVVVFDVARKKIQAKLKAGDQVLGPAAFTPDGRTLVAVSQASYCEFKAKGKTGNAWDFSEAVRRLHQVGPLSTFASSVAFLRDAHTLAAAGGNTAALIDTTTDQIRNFEVNGLLNLAAVNSGGDIVVSSDLYRVDLYDAATGARRRTLWGRSPGISPSVFVVALVVWVFIHAIRRAAQKMRACQTCGKKFAPANKRDQSLECPSCRRQARLKSLTPSQLSREPYRRSWRVAGRLLPLVLMLLLLSLAGGLSWRALWLLAIPLLIPAWIGFLWLKYLLLRRRTIDERRDLRLAEHCAAACGEVRRVGGLVIWSAEASKLIDEFEPHIEICRQRLQAVLGEPVPPPDGARALVFADHSGLARYLSELRTTPGSGPRFNAVYLFAPLKKMLIAERELIEQSADSLMRLRALILYHLIERCDPCFQQGWLAYGLVAALARDDGDGELARFTRRTRAALRSGRVIEPHEIFDRRTNRTIRRVRRRGDRALHAWVMQYHTQAWSLIEFLCGRGSTPDRLAAFRRFWNDAARRRDAGATLARHYGTSVDELFREWRAWLERQPAGEHQPPPPHLAAWMLRGPLATVADAAAVRRDRIVATRILGELGFAFGADHLIELLRGDDPLLREEAVWALECISGEVRGASPVEWDAWWQSVPDAARNAALAPALDQSAPAREGVSA